jgi:hypothetical protein
MKKAIALFYLVFLQPPGLITWAGIIVLFHVAFRLLGWRELTTVLSGTFPPNVEPTQATTCATLYLASYFAAILLAPIMALAATFRLLSAWISRRRTTA